MNLKRLLSVALLTALPVGPATAQEPRRWIVLDEDVATTFAASLAIVDDVEQLDSAFIVTEFAAGRALARLDASVEELLHRVMHTGFRRCGGYTMHPDRQTALVELHNPYYAPDYSADPDRFPHVIDQQTHVRPALPRVDRQRIVATIRTLQDFGSRYYQSQAGQSAALGLKRQWEGYGGGRADFSVAMYPHNWRQDSVIATIRGAELPDEVVVIGGHLDSINSRDTSVAPGADDDASGIAVVSEVLRVVLESGFRPRRTLQFMAYAAEEVGLRGSRQIARAYRDAGTNVIAALQLDMTGYAGSAEDMYFITDYVSADLTGFLKDLIREYNGAGPHRITHGETSCGYGCSDHVSWTWIGVPAAFPFETRFGEHNPAIHQPGDTIANLDRSGQHQTRFAKLGVEFMMELGKSAATSPRSLKDRYLYTSLRVISSSAPRGCRVNDWNCMTRLCKRDLGAEAWRAWAGCWNRGARFTCNFECGLVRGLQ